MGKNRQRGHHRQSTDSSSVTSGGSNSKARGNKSKQQQQQQQRSSAAVTEAASAGAAAAAAAAASSSKQTESFVWSWLYAERQGLIWIAGCALVGALLGFGIGTGHLTGAAGQDVAPWRVALGARIRGSPVYQVMTLQLNPFARSDSMLDLRNNPSHPRVFAMLREAVIREKGGYVHPDLGMMVPAPSGAARGLGMVRSGFSDCQMRCVPGTAQEAKANFGLRNPKTAKLSEPPVYRQQEVLLRIPLGYQMTRKVALDTLIPLLPADFHRNRNIAELDDAALLVLLLAHERGRSRASKWLPYIASLPAEPSCGYSEKARPYLLDTIAAMEGELGLDTNGWAGELTKAAAYANDIVGGLHRDYGSYIDAPEGMSGIENIAWALCQVASRATAGSERNGVLRLVPIIDLINHDVAAGGFIELTGKEKASNGQFLDSSEEDCGTFVMRSVRNGRRKPLKKGQELMANYNVPGYTPLDWFVSLGFVPPERWHKWQKIDPALPRVRADGPFGPENQGEAKSADSSSSGASNNEFLNRAGSRVPRG